MFGLPWILAARGSFSLGFLLVVQLKGVTPLRCDLPRSSSPPSASQSVETMSSERQTSPPLR